jgi:hypothetical protein
MPKKLQVASPCSADWEKMVGDDRVRYCPECKLSVYNFSAMTEAEVKRIVAHRGGRLCGRLYRRADGTLLTQNCPVGLRLAVLRASRAAVAALAAVMSVQPLPTLARPQPNRANPYLLLQIQSVRPAFSLRVIDQSGAVIAEAQVTLTDEATLKKTEGKTGVNGELRLSELEHGLYQVTIASTGFYTRTLSRVKIPKHDVIEVTLPLSALMGEIIEVPQQNAFHRFISHVRHLF